MNQIEQNAEQGVLFFRRTLLSDRVARAEAEERIRKESSAGVAAPTVRQTERIGPTFSLIVGTLGRVRELEKLLDSLVGQSETEFEVIVIDQNPDSRLAFLPGRYDGKLNLRLVRHPSSGISAARNAGLHLAGGEFCAFPDDDCVYPAGVLERIRKKFEETGADGLSLRVTDSRGRCSAGGFMGHRESRISRSNVWRCAVSPGLFFRRNVLLRCGGFDESLGVGAPGECFSAEDSELVLRLLREGRKIHYLPSLTIGHPAPSWTGNFLRAYRYGLGMGRVLADYDYSFLQVCRYAFWQHLRSVQRLCQGRVRQARWHWNMGMGRLAGFCRRNRGRL